MYLRVGLCAGKPFTSSKRYLTLASATFHSTSDWPSKTKAWSLSAKPSQRRWPYIRFSHRFTSFLPIRSQTATSFSR